MYSILTPMAVTSSTDFPLLPNQLLCLCVRLKAPVDAPDSVRYAILPLGPGTLYGAIARLEARKWIEPLPAEDRRRPYRLTSAGQKVLRARLESMRTMARVAQSRLAES